MLTRWTFRLIASFSTFFVLGILFGNPIFIYMGLVPLSLTLVGLPLKQPESVKLRRSEQRTDVLVNGVVKNTVEIEIEDGIGLVALADELPEEFELVDGSNFKVVWKGPGAKRERLSYSVRCTKRGVYRPGGIRWESRHPLNLRQTVFGRYGERRVTVRPRLLDAKKVRGATTASRMPLPAGAVTRTGPPTMDFRELRAYSPGDPFRYINWKATARNVSGGYLWPVVNEYEREGRRLVWIFLDGSPPMGLGTSVSNVFEYALEVTNSLAHYYLRRGCRVGLTVYNGEGKVLPPGTGKGQYARILGEILRLGLPLGAYRRGEEWYDRYGRPWSSEEEARRHLGYYARLGGERPEETEFSSLKKAVWACRKYLSGRRPLSIVVSRFARENAEAQAEGIKELSKYGGRRRGRLPVMVVNVAGYGLAARSPEEEEAGRVLWVKDGLSLRGLRKGVIWVDWDPKREGFTDAMLRRVARR